MVQPDLFTLDSPLYGEIRGERSIAAFPFFALTKAVQMKPLEYRTENVSIEVHPSSEGVATIYDKEIVLYIASLMVAKIDAGEKVSQDFTFTANDFFRVTGGGSSSRSYARLQESLLRLQGTQIRTNIEAGGEGEDGFFSWLSEANSKYIKRDSGERRLKSVKVRLCDWLYRAIIKDKRILTYHRDYFQLGPIERRLYELARSHDNGDAVFATDIATLRIQVGSHDADRRFKHALKAIADADAVPEYHIALRDVAVAEVISSVPAARRRKPRTQTMVEFTPRARNSGRLASRSHTVITEVAQLA